MRPLAISILCFFYLFVSQSLIAQDRAQIIEILSKYRTQVLHNKADEIKAFESLKSRWIESGIDSTVVASFCGQLYYAHSVKDFSYKFINKRLDKLPGAKPFIGKFSPEDLTIIHNCADLFDLTGCGVIEGNAPYNLKPTFVEEIENYGIKNGMSVGDIGAGNGIFPMMLALIYEDLSIYVNELRVYYLDYLEEKLKIVKTKKNTFHIVNGKKKSTQLETVKLDRIIVRNTFHHFKKKEKMMNSIKTSLGENSRLFIKEFPLEWQKLPLGCKHYISEKEIMSYMKNGIFEVIDTNRIDTGLIIELKKYPYFFKT